MYSTHISYSPLLAICLCLTRHICQTDTYPSPLPTPRTSTPPEGPLSPLQMCVGPIQWPCVFDSLFLGQKKRGLRKLRSVPPISAPPPPADCHGHRSAAHLHRGPHARHTGQATRTVPGAFPDEESVHRGVLNIQGTHVPPMSPALAPVCSPPRSALREASRRHPTHHGSCCTPHRTLSGTVALRSSRAPVRTSRARRSRGALCSRATRPKKPHTSTCVTPR